MKYIKTIFLKTVMTKRMRISVEIPTMYPGAELRITEDSSSQLSLTESHLAIVILVTRVTLRTITIRIISNSLPTTGSLIIPAAVVVTIAITTDLAEVTKTVIRRGCSSNKDTETGTDARAAALEDAAVTIDITTMIVDLNNTNPKRRKINGSRRNSKRKSLSIPTKRNKDANALERMKRFCETSKEPVVAAKRKK